MNRSKDSIPVITKEQFLRQVKPYASTKTKQAYIDGYLRGYFDKETGRNNRFTKEKEK